MDAFANCARIYATATGAEEYGLATSAANKIASDGKPISDCARGRQTEGHDSLLITLTRNSYSASFEIQVAHIDGAQL
jgi:hypothetical protein